VTDRGKRYKANRDVTDSKSAGCLFCGSRKNLTVDHLDGYEEHGEPANLAWLCKSCNTRKGATFARAGVGRATEQYNPCLTLSPAERKNATQLGFGFPPRAEYDAARAAERKRRQQEHAREIKARREARAEDRRRAKAEAAVERKRLEGRISDLALRMREARAAGDKSKAEDLRSEINWLLAERGNPGGASSPKSWASAVAVVLGLKRGDVGKAARTIRSTPPAKRRAFAAQLRANPSKYPTYAQYGFAVASHVRESHDAGGAIIHRTPKSLRREYAGRIAETKRSRGTASRGGEVPF
jgi:hypothetical protein